MKVFIRTFFSLLFLLIPSLLAAQSFSWVQLLQLADNVSASLYVSDIALSESGGIYLSARGGETEFGDVTLSAGSFLAKFTSTGSIEWALSVPISMSDIAVDAKGKGLYGVGNWNGIVVTRYDLEGNHVWTTNVSRPDTIRARATSIDIDAEGNIYVTGMVEREAFVAKLDGSGNILWTRRFTSTGGDFIPVWAPTALTLDNKGNVYVTVDVNDLAAADMTIIKLDPSGETVWMRNKIGSVPTAIAYDGNDGLAVTMTFRGPGSIADSIWATEGQYPNTALARYNTDGDLVSLVPFFSSGTYTGVGIHSLAFTSNELFLIGWFGGDTMRIQGKEAVGNARIHSFIARFTNDLTLTTLDTLINEMTEPYDIIVKTEGDNIFLTGAMYAETTNLWGTPLPVHNHAIFVGKIENTLSVDERGAEASSESITLSPNPVLNTARLSTDYSHIDRIAIYSIDGRLIYQIEPQENTGSTEIDLTNLPPGTYQIVLDGDKGRTVRNMMKL